MTQPWDNKALSLKARQGLKKYQNVLEEALKDLTNATKGAPWTFETDYAALWKIIENSNYADDMGDVVFARVRAVSRLFEYSNNGLASDPLPPVFKKAFIERLTKHKLVLEVNLDSKVQTERQTTMIQGKTL